MVVEESASVFVALASITGAGGVNSGFIPCANDQKKLVTVKNAMPVIMVGVFNMSRRFFRAVNCDNGCVAHCYIKLKAFLTAISTLTDGSASKIRLRIFCDC